MFRWAPKLPFGANRPQSFHRLTAAGVPFTAVTQLTKRALLITGPAGQRVTPESMSASPCSQQLTLSSAVNTRQRLVATPIE
jgi:hypothetical protein